MKVLIVSPVPTDPGGLGNRERVRTLAGEIAQMGHTVHFAHIGMEGGDVEAMKSRFGEGRFHALPWRPPLGVERLARAGARRVGRLFRADLGYLYSLDEWYDPAISDTLRALHAHHQFDAVIAEYVFASRALTVFERPTLRILDTHDCFAMRHRRYLAANEEPRWFSTSEANETRAFRRADVVLGIQEEETALYRQRLRGTATSAVTVGHFAAASEHVTDPDNCSALFLGSDNPINVAAARYFVKDVMPLVTRVLPHFRLVLAGSVSEHVEAASGVLKLGRVGNVRDAFSAASVFLNPVRMGTGINIKLLDAMTHGVACITTVCGARGLDRYAPHALRIVRDEDPGQLAGAITELLTNSPARHSLAAAARDCIQMWNAEVRGALQEVLGRATSQPRAAMA